MRRLALLLTLAVALASAACGHSSSPEPACCADVVLVGIGGPVASSPQHWAGSIHVRGRAFATVRTDRRGHATLRLPAGWYRFTATSASYDGGRGVCNAAHPVRLRSHHTAHVRVICQLK